MDSIGGYIELQLPTGTEYYPSFIKLNTGRNALEYILRIRKYSAIYLPYFTCDVMLEPVKKLGIELKRYHLDQNLDPVTDFVVQDNECFVYTNYFGLKQRSVEKLATEVKNLIIDNSQGFFSVPLQGLDTFYSCRKFFGVPDGAYLYLDSPQRLPLKNDISVDRFSHLIKSIDLSIEDGYSDYIENNKMLSDTSIKEMSSLTQRILCGIDYDDCRERRNANFSFLHNHLADYNEFNFDLSDVNGPLIYPLLIAKQGLKQYLIKHKIFVATYWPNVLEWTTSDMYENYLTQNIIALPIDHRYGLDDMSKMINILNQFL